MANNYEVILSNDSEATVTLSAQGYEKLIRESERLAILGKLATTLADYDFRKVRALLFQRNDELKVPSDE